MKISQNTNNLIIKMLKKLTTELVREYPSLQGQVVVFTQDFLVLTKKVNAFSTQYEFSNKNIENDLSFVLSLSQKSRRLVWFFCVR